MLTPEVKVMSPSAGPAGTGSAAMDARKGHSAFARDARLLMSAPQLLAAVAVICPKPAADARVARLVQQQLHMIAHRHHRQAVANLRLTGGFRLDDEQHLPEIGRAHV